MKFSKEMGDENGLTHKHDNSISTFGLKNHIAVGKRHGTIRFSTTTAASA
ncbi:hypothetical protein [uncultured Bartonella sp.]|nr:hypothetical protein [uncultured Bartonella sp.]